MAKDRAITARPIGELAALPEGVLVALAEGMKLSRERLVSRLGSGFERVAEDLAADGTVEDNISHILLWADLSFCGEDEDFVKRIEEADKPPWPAVLAAVKAVRAPSSAEDEDAIALSSNGGRSVR